LRRHDVGFGKKRSYDDIINSIRQKSDAAPTEQERRLYEAHLFEAYFYHQGGFDYYLAHVDEVKRWGLAVGALIVVGRDDATPISTKPRSSTSNSLIPIPTRRRPRPIWRR
jgi:hypothetical protein